MQGGFSGALSPSLCVRFPMAFMPSPFGRLLAYREDISLGVGCAKPLESRRVLMHPPFSPPNLQHRLVYPHEYSTPIIAHRQF